MKQTDSRIDTDLPPGVVRAGAVGDSVDETVPRWVVAPACEKDLVTSVQAAVNERRTIICTGGRTSVCVGNPPRSFDLALDTRKLDRIVERRSEDMTMTVQAGMTVQSLAAELAVSGQRIAWDPDTPERATVGGVLASNSTGGFAYGFGQPRDFVLGITVVDGRGRVLRLGGRVVKNVAGYDLVRLFTGSHGTLGVITEATLRTHPLPDFARTLHVRFADPEHLDSARAALFASHLPLAALDFELACATIPPVWMLRVRVEGSSNEVETQCDRVRRLCQCDGDEDVRPWRSSVHASADAEIVVRVGIAPADAIAFARDLERAYRRPLHIGGRLGDGTLRVSTRNVDVDDETVFVDNVCSVAHDHNGLAVIERISSKLKRERSVWDERTAPIGLMREIKARFDPDGLFAPGRFVGGL